MREARGWSKIVFRQLRPSLGVSRLMNILPRRFLIAATVAAAALLLAGCASTSEPPRDDHDTLEATTGHVCL